MYYFKLLKNSSLLIYILAHFWNDAIFLDINSLNGSFLPKKWIKRRMNSNQYRLPLVLFFIWFRLPLVHQTKILDWNSFSIQTFIKLWFYFSLNLIHNEKLSQDYKLRNVHIYDIIYEVKSKVRISSPS